MRKNAAGQFVKIGLINKTDGTPVTDGETIAYVTVDNGTQTIGSVGSGVCAHKGRGEWVYAPSQAETNGDHVSFVFTNLLALNGYRQYDTNYPQTGDAFVRLGAPSGASTAADIGTRASQSTLDSYVTTITAKTNNLPASPAAVGSAMTLTSAYDFAKGSVPMVEAYAADGATMTPAQAFYMIWAFLAERAITGATLVAKKLDGSTTAMSFTLDSATEPSSQTRSG